MSLQAELVATFTERQLTFATAESLTAGLIAAGIADVPGASAVLVGGAVTYATDRKASILGVDQQLLAEHGAVHPEVAKQMALGARELFAADVAVSATGVAGPSEQDGKSVGTVFIACAVSPERTGRECTPASVRCEVVEFHLTGDRTSIRQQTTQEAWSLALKVVHDMTP